MENKEGSNYTLEQHIYEMAVRLKALRLYNNLERKEFGDIVRVSERQVARWEKGDVSPRPAKVKEIAEIFHLPDTVLHYGAAAEDYAKANPDNKSLYIFMDYQIKKIYEAGETEGIYEHEPAVDTRDAVIELTELLRNEKKIISINGLVLSPEERRTLAAAVTTMYK